jgi:osmotically-inducible protein OsmY
VSIKTKDNTKEVLSAMEKAIERGLVAVGMTAEGHAKKYETAVDTGRLRNSITWALSGEEANTKEYEYKVGEETKKGTYQGTAPIDRQKAVYIGSNVEYAPYVELGAKGRDALHFLKRAATDHTDEYKKLMEGSMRRA